MHLLLGNSSSSIIIIWAKASHIKGAEYSMLCIRTNLLEGQDLPGINAAGREKGERRERRRERRGRDTSA